MSSDRAPSDRRWGRGLVFTKAGQAAARRPVTAAERDMIDRAVAEGRVTQCPASHVATTPGATMFGGGVSGLVETAEIAALLRVERAG